MAQGTDSRIGLQSASGPGSGSALSEVHLFGLARILDSVRFQGDAVFPPCGLVNVCRWDFSRQMCLILDAEAVLISLFGFFNWDSRPVFWTICHCLFLKKIFN